jgi:hypothetical protein
MIFGRPLGSSDKMKSSGWSWSGSRKFSGKDPRRKRTTGVLTWSATAHGTTYRSSQSPAALSPVAGIPYPEQRKHYVAVRHEVKEVWRATWGTDPDLPGFVGSINADARVKFEEMAKRREGA